jgi:hypothetical protein
MRKPLIFAAITLFAVSTGTAMAEHADHSLHRTSPNRAMLADEFKNRIDSLGYDLRSVEVDDGAFKTRIVDRESGLPVKAKFDSFTGELLRAAPGSE